MRVLHVETGRHLYGGGLQVRYLIEGLSKLGVENHLVAPLASAISRAAASVCKVHETPMAGDFDIFFSLRLMRWIGRVRPDILHLHSRRGADIWGAVAARATGTPSVVTRRVDNPESRIVSVLKYRAFDRVIAISEKISRVLQSQGVSGDHITVVHSAVDPHPYAGPCDADRFRAEFHLPADSPVIGVIAQLIERKGHRDLITAMPQIIRDHPNVRFLFLGKGPEERHLRELCRARGVQAHVIFTGFREDLEKILPCLTLVVHPATLEGLGVALLQASAAGVPIVACRAGGIPEVVADGVTGLLVPPGKPNPLAQAIGHILAHPEIGRRLGENGRQRVHRRFSIAAMAWGNLDVYRHLVDAK